jgi:hypothetical protein
MNIIMLLTVLSLGLSENIETRLPEDPGMIYTVAFDHEGVNIGLDWKNRQVLAERACRKSSQAERIDCQTAALSWLRAECAWYDQKKALTATQAGMQNAICKGAQDLARHLNQKQLARR